MKSSHEDLVADEGYCIVAILVTSSDPSYLLMQLDCPWLFVLEHIFLSSIYLVLIHYKDKAKKFTS